MSASTISTRSSGRQRLPEPGEPGRHATRAAGDHACGHHNRRHADEGAEPRCAEHAATDASRAACHDLTDSSKYLPDAAPNLRSARLGVMVRTTNGGLFGIENEKGHYVRASVCSCCDCRRRCRWR